MSAPRLRFSYTLKPIPIAVLIAVLVTVLINTTPAPLQAMALQPGMSQAGGDGEVNRVVPGECIIQISAEDFHSNAFRPALAVSGRTGLARLDGVLGSIGSVTLRPAFDSSFEREAHAKAGLDRIFVVTYRSDLAPGEAARLLSRNAGVVYAEPNGMMVAQLSPNDTYYPNQWAHNNTGQAVSYGGALIGSPDCDTDTDQAWDLQTGSASLILAIVDTGVDLGHPEFAGRLVAGYDYINNDSDPTDDNGHGTCCAGIAAGAGNNAQGIAGVAWGVKIMPVKVLDSAGSGSYTAVGNGVTFAADHGAKIISMSLGGGANATLQAACDYAYGRGVAIFAAAGNSNRSSLDYPAAYSSVIAVGALSPCNERKSTGSCDGESWWGSNYGTGLDFMAPGVRIHTADIRGAGGFGSGDYITDFNGTSSATPHAAGIGALVLSQNPALTNAGLLTVLQNNCDDMGTAGYDTNTGYGRMNAFRSVQNAGGGGGGNPVTIFSEGFEVNTVPGSVWSASDANSTSGLDYWGDQSSPARLHTGSWSAYCADHSNVSGQVYDNNMTTAMTKVTPVSLTGYTNVQFSFWLWNRTYNASDYVALQYWNGSTWVETQRWSGAATGWIHPTYTVTGSSFQFRFYFFSNGSSTQEGAYVDDILITGVPGAAREPMAISLALVPGEENGAAQLAAGDPAEPTRVSGGRLALSAAPNPLRSSTSLSYTLSSAADVRLEVFRADGRRVAVLAQGSAGAGSHSVLWNGLDADGRSLSSGIYYARLSVEGADPVQQRLTLLR